MAVPKMKSESKPWVWMFMLRNHSVASWAMIMPPRPPNRICAMIIQAMFPPLFVPVMTARRMPVIM